jgi:cytochrome c peroxidase
LRIFVTAVFLVGAIKFTAIPVEAKQLSIEIEHRFSTSAAKLNELGTLEDGRVIDLRRVDYLLSDFALKSAASQKWIQGEDLAAYMSLGEGHQVAELGYVPAGEFQAIRFRVGVDSQTNASDPHQFPAEHPLNPQVNDLHWGWSGGYIFLAIEGMTGEEEAFSFHLANDGNAPLVTIPVSFDTTRDCTIRVGFDIDRLFAQIDFSEDGYTSHSREGDSIPKKLAAALPAAFELAGVHHQKFQRLQRTEVEEQTAHGTPYPLQVTNRFPKVTLPGDNPLTIEGVELGKALFSDKRLSKNDSQSCASCHDSSRAFADGGKRVSIGADGITGKRNTQPLFNLAWHDGFLWDGRAQTLREQVLMPITDPHEMNAKLEDVVLKLNRDDRILKKVEKAFGEPQVTPDNLARALEQFLLTLVSQDSKFDRATRGDAEFSLEEKRGLELFVTEYDPARNLRGADCFHCHGGNLFSSRRYTNNGLDAEPSDLGLFVTTANAADIGKFKTPSLRNIAITGPYMHDGRFETLEEVVDHYDHGVKPSATLDPNLAKHPASGLDLSAADKRALVAFLKTLTDHQFLAE